MLVPGDAREIYGEIKKSRPVTPLSLSSRPETASQREPGSSATRETLTLPHIVAPINADASSYLPPELTKIRLLKPQADLWKTSESGGPPEGPRIMFQLPNINVPAGSNSGPNRPSLIRRRRQRAKDARNQYSWLQQNKLYQESLYEQGFRVLEGTNGTKMCSVCNEQFAKEMFVWRHALQHIAGKPFHCPSCHQRFTRADTLQRHVQKSGHYEPSN